MNDEINRKLREKHHWDKQILALGGPNYLSRQTPAELDGKSLPGKGFYKCVDRRAARSSTIRRGRG